MNKGTYVYPAIAQWLRQTGVALKTLAERAWISESCITNVMKGKETPSKYTIDQILAVTGMTYEEAFRQEEKEEYDE